MCDKVISSPLFGTPKKVTIIKGEDEPVVGVSSLFTNAVKRKRLEVTDSDFQKYSQDALAISEAKNIVLTTNVDNLRYELVLDIGREFQERHTKFIELILNFSNDKTVNETKAEVSDILSLLQDSPVEKKWFGKSFNIHEVSVKLNKLSHELKDNVDGLNQLGYLIQGARKGIEALMKQIEPYIIAVSFFADYKKEGFPSDLFITRLTSLMSTKQTLAVNLQQLDLIRDSVRNYNDIISNIVLTEIPIWITSCLNPTLIQNNSQVLESNRTSLIDKIKQKINI